MRLYKPYFHLPRYHQETRVVTSSAEELGTMSKNNLRGISLGIKPTIWVINSLYYPWSSLDAPILNRKFLDSTILFHPSKSLGFEYTLSSHRGLFLLPCSIRENNGRVFSVKLGSYKFVMASTTEAVNEMLIKKSADYAGRPQTYTFFTQTLGKLMAYI